MKEIVENQNREETLEKTEDKLLSILTGITWVTALIAFAGILSKNIGIVVFICSGIALSTGLLVKPFIILFRESKERLISLKEKCHLALKFFLIFICMLCAYIIIVSPYYDLYWSYWGLIITILFLVLIERFRQQKSEEDLKEEDGKGRRFFKKAKSIGAFVLSIILALPNIYQLYTPKLTITLKDLEMPSRIEVDEVDAVEAVYGRSTSLYQRHQTIFINREDDIRGLIEALEGITIENMNIIQELNYLKMQKIEAPYYHLYLNYGNVNIMKEVYKDEEKSKDTRRYIYSIEVYPNGRVYLEMVTGGKRRFQIFPVDMKDEILQEFMGNVMI